MVYPLALRYFAEQLGIRIVMPTFSYGNWESPEALEIIAKLMEDLESDSYRDIRRIFLAGISQGGAGVSRAGAAMPERFAGLIYFSPTMELNIVESVEFKEAWRSRPILVLQGGQDWHVSVRKVNAAVDSMRNSGVKITFIFDPDEDHFFFFGQRDRLIDVVGKWMETA
jgi:predicted esterase